MLDEIHEIARFSGVGDMLSYARLAGRALLELEDSPTHAPSRAPEPHGHALDSLTL